MTKILVADDEQNILALLEIILKELDADVICAEDGQIVLINCNMKRQIYYH